MAMIKKLSIQGVRSFSPADNKGQWIEFGSPLTLILGVNGSGKTTIIETLKYAITSQFPPNSAKGSSFVNDPKLSFNETSLAKVSLELEDSNGNTYTTTRKVKVTVKNYKGELSMQQLEGNLRVKGKTGDVKQLTNKCGEMKFELCRVMGVSEAMLNYVIFCHQEDSCWPLDEGKRVKETFDAIFNTTAYKKCFDKLSTVDKDFITRIKIEDEGLKGAKEIRDMAVKNQNELDDKNIKLIQQTENIKEYEREIKIMEKRLLEFQMLEHEYAKKQSEVAEKKTKMETVSKHIGELRKNIKEEFSGSMAELKDKMNKFKEERLKKKNMEKQLCEDHKKKEIEWDKLNSTKNKLIKEEGMLQQEEDTNKKRVEELNLRLSTIVSDLKQLKSEVSEEMLSMSFSSFVDACESDPDNLSYDAVLKTLTSAIRMKDSEIQKVKSKFDEEEKQLQSAIDEVRTKLAQAETEKDLKRSELSNNRKTQDDIKKRLKALERSDDTLRTLDVEEENCKEKIDEIENSGFMTKCESEIKSLAAEIKAIDSKIATASENVNVLANDKTKVDQIAILTRQKLQKQNDCNEALRRMEDDLKTILEEIPKDGLGNVLDSKLKLLNNELKGNKAELKKKEEALTGFRTEVKLVKQELKKNELQLKNGKSKASDILEGKDYDEVYSEASEELSKVQSDSSYAESASFLYKRYLAKLNKSNCCPLCKRDFETRSLLEKLMKEIDGEIKRMTENVPQLKQDVEQAKLRQELILKAKPVWDECQKLEREIIPELKSKKAELEEKIEQLNEETENLTMIVSELDTNVGIASKCRSSVAVYEQMFKEVKKLENQVDRIESSRDQDAKDLEITFAEAQTQLQELQTSIKIKRTEKESKEEIRNKKRNELARLQEEKNKIKEDKLKITAELQNREALENQRKELESTNVELQAKIGELTKALPSLKSDIVRTEKDKSSCIQRKEVAIKKIHDEKDALDKQKFSISELRKRITDFEKKRGKLIEVQKSVADCNDKLEMCERQKKDITGEIDKLRKDLNSRELQQRELEDNLSLKEKLEEVSQLKLQLAEKEKILSQAENRGVASEKRELSLKHHTMNAKLNELKGSTNEIRKRIRDLENELKTPKFANAEKNYITRVAQRFVYQKTLQDIRRYKTALDTAIMQFHHKKMEKINKILLEYWRRIYKGNDIDKIMIKTEADRDPNDESKSKKVKVTTKTVRKSYNYRVVMVRKGVEIDMRGRCSAGQRVLASIIIRIALAESFGARCGIISLDEPTTNLDQKNINSLADALSDLAEKMSSRKSFQLIVITHDQEFTQRLSAIDAVEHYWKVDRDKEGFSQITIVKKRGYDD